MWILPNNYQPSSAFVADTVESKEDLTLLESSSESSLMWRSKPSPLQTWSLRWNRVNWIPHLFGRILKPSQHTYFEEQLTLSLAAILASRSHQQESEKEQTTLDICGHSSGTTLMPFDQIDVFSRTSKDTSRWDCPQSSATWKKMVIQQRGEYSQRVKLAQHTRESESLSWPTPVASEASLGYQDRSTGKKGTQESLTTVVINRMGGRDAVSGQLNPQWVEWLMGVPSGWTDLGSWGTE